MRDGGRSCRRELVQGGFGKHSIWEKAFYSDVLAVIKKCGAIVGLLFLKGKKLRKNKRKIQVKLSSDHLKLKMVPAVGIEPTRSQAPRDFESII